MSRCIAIAGKGGVGKTLVGGLLVHHLAARGEGPVLAVDADANQNLNEVLGLPAAESIGAIREEMKVRAAEPGFVGMTKAQFLEFKVEEALSEGERFDLLAMGRPEGPGCYCYANNILREILARVANRYRYVVVDNEAGMEHMSRRIVRDVDLLLVVSDASLRGLQAAARLSVVPDEVETRVRRKALLVNRVGPDGLSDAAREMIDGLPLEYLGAVANDPEVVRCDQQLGALASLYPGSAMAQRVGELALAMATGAS